MTLADFDSAASVVRVRVTQPFGPLFTFTTTHTTKGWLDAASSISTSSQASTALLPPYPGSSADPIRPPGLVFFIRSRRTKRADFSVGVADEHDENRPDKHPFKKRWTSLRGYEFSTTKDAQFILGRELWLVRGQTYKFLHGSHNDV